MPYTYEFHPLAGTPKNLDRSRPVVEIDVETEPLYGGTHDVFFNRGVASSQRYALRFGNLRPDRQPTERKRKEALAWLSRDLDDAMLRFIRSARPGNAIRGCFYEFTYGPVLDELKKAIDQGVDVKLVVDLKVNEHTSNERQPDGSTKAVFHASDPRLREPRGDPHRRDSRLGDRQARIAAVRHRAQQVHGAADRRGPAAHPGLDRVHEPHRRRGARPGQRRALDPGSRGGHGRSSTTGTSSSRIRAVGPTTRPRPCARATPRSTTTSRRSHPVPADRRDPARDRRRCSVPARGSLRSTSTSSSPRRRRRWPA